MWRRKCWTRTCWTRTIGALIQVRNSLSSDSVAAAIDLLSAARRIEFYGAGGSGITALDMQHKFFRLDVPSVAYSDPHTYTTSAALLREGDVVVAISNTGRTRDILDACKSALRGGARVIAITHGNSPLRRIASIGLFANFDEETDIFSPMTSRISQSATFWRWDWRWRADRRWPKNSPKPKTCWRAAGWNLESARGSRGHASCAIRRV